MHHPVDGSRGVETRCPWLRELRADIPQAGSSSKSTKYGLPMIGGACVFARGTTMRWGTHPALALALAFALCAVAAEYTASAGVHDELAWHKHQLVRDAAHPWRPQQPYIPHAGVSAQPTAVPPRAVPPEASATAATPATKRSLVWAVVQGALTLFGWGIGILTYVVLAVPKALLDTALLAYAFTVNMVALVTRHPLQLLRSVAHTVYVYVYELCAPLRYVGSALYLVFVAWPMAALSSVMYVAYQFYVIAGVAVLLGVLLGLVGGAFLALENRLYVFRRGSSSSTR